MQEYCDFADFFWIAVPAVLEEDARNILSPGWGLLVITDDADAALLPPACASDRRYRHSCPRHYLF